MKPNMNHKRCGKVTRFTFESNLNRKEVKEVEEEKVGCKKKGKNHFCHPKFLANCV
jgi:hypothetical protein